MSQVNIARLFRNGRSQAVRLPQEFRFEGDVVRIRRFGGGVLLEPSAPDAAAWFEELDRFTEPFMSDAKQSRNQPPTPRRPIF
jgi:antitoxin VapB